MITINQEVCIGCGKCVSDCFPREIKLVDKKAQTRGKRCIECGHCIAVCPVNAITLEGYDMDEVLEAKEHNVNLDPETYLNHMKFRRSIRKFKDTAVSKEEIETILDAGRFSPTGGNMQNVSYTVIMNEIDSVKDKIFEELKAMGEAAKKSGNPISWYSVLWIKMYEEYKKAGTDRLFFQAPAVIVVSSDSPQSGCLAAAHMETMIYSMGLGMLYSGFSQRAINHSAELREYLQIKEGYEVQTVLIIGHPDVSYVRTVPRKKADVIWK